MLPQIGPGECASEHRLQTSFPDWTRLHRWLPDQVFPCFSPSTPLYFLPIFFCHTLSSFSLSCLSHTLLFLRPCLDRYRPRSPLLPLTCPVPCALCSVPSALCPLPCALCPVPCGALFDRVTFSLLAHAKWPRGAARQRCPVPCALCPVAPSSIG